ncbi:hypothetical protein GW17_00056957 [Ensete ventricosum]|nr:hypothetical protein GW17_00056957 [Ensete ventricosum]
MVVATTVGRGRRSCAPIPTAHRRERPRAAPCRPAGPGTPQHVARFQRPPPPVGARCQYPMIDYITHFPHPS